MKTNVKALTAASYLSMLFLGVSSSLIGAAARNIGLTADQIGLLLTIQNVGFMIAVWVSGALSDNQEKPRILLIGSLILALSFFTFYLTDSFWLNMFIMMMIGIGVGTYEGVTDPMLIDMHEERQSLHININHFFVTLGSILITLYLIFLEMNWRVSLVQSAVVVLILAAIYAVFRLEKRPAPAEDYLQRIRIISKNKVVAALFLATVLLVGVELGTVGILTTYLMDLRDFTQTTSKLGLITFLVGIASGRVIIGYFIPDEKIPQTILGQFGVAAVAFFGMFFLGIGQWSYVAIFLAGFSISATLPMIITLAGKLFPEMAGTVIGSIKVAIPIGGIVVPFLMTMITSQISFRASLLLFPALLLLAFGVLLWAFRELGEQ